jgi:hypothetical protein
LKLCVELTLFCVAQSFIQNFLRRFAQFSGQQNGLVMHISNHTSPETWWFDDYPDQPPIGGPYLEFRNICIGCHGYQVGPKAIHQLPFYPHNPYALPTEGKPELPPGHHHSGLIVLNVGTADIGFYIDNPSINMNRITVKPQTGVCIGGHLPVGQTVMDQALKKNAWVQLFHHVGSHHHSPE